MALIRCGAATSQNALSPIVSVPGANSGGGGGILTYTFSNMLQYSIVSFKAGRWPSGSVTCNGATYTGGSDGTLTDITSDTVTLSITNDTTTDPTSGTACGLLK